MLLRFTTLLLICILLSCNTESDTKPSKTEELQETTIAFDKIKWKEKKGFNYPHREEMLDHILYNDDFRKLNESEVLEMLGEPDRINESHLYYQITQKRLGIWPLHTKTMVIKFGEDEVMEWIRINE